MKVLSIDTSSKICAVAVLEKNENEIIVLKEISQDNGLTHSENLMPMIKEVLEDIKLELKDIDLIVCDKGPGSFTGIRIGVATVKAFSDSLGIPTIGVTSLEALAYNVQLPNIQNLSIDNNLNEKSNECDIENAPEISIICPLIDARNNSAYWTIFEKEHNKYTLKRDFSADEISIILEEVSKYNEVITFVGDGAEIYKDIILQKLPNSKFVNRNILSAVNLGIAGIKHFEESGHEDILPLYIRKPQAERMLEGKLNEV